MTTAAEKFSTVPLNWKEVWYTNCPVVSASNVDEALGWTREEFEKIGVKYAYFRSVRENDWYPHYIHNLDNLIRVGGLFPPVHVHADIRRTRLLGATHVYEGGCMMVGARDDIYRMAEQHPELVVAFMKGMIKVGRWANEYKQAAAAILDKQTDYLDVQDTYRGIKDVDMVPNLSPLNLASVEIGKNFMLKHGYIKNDFDVTKWAAPKFLEQAAKELLEEQWKKATTAKLPETTELLKSSQRVG
jgi:hypothetical protein